jgi:hypothetical protein
MSAPAEGPATVTLTDDERALLADAWIYRPVGNLEDWMRPVERIVAARVAALTADLAAAERQRDDARSAGEAYRRLRDEAEQVIANVRALADEWDRLPEGVVIDVRVEVTGPLRALLPAAPTGEQS